MDKISKISNRIILSLVMCLYAAQSQASSSHSGGCCWGKIAVLDMQTVSEKSHAISDMNEQLKARGEAFEKKIGAYEKEMKKEKESIDEKKSIVSESEYENLQNALNKKVHKIQEEIGVEQDAVSKAQMNAITAIQDKLNDVVKDIAKKQKIYMVLGKAVAIHVDEKADITEDVVSKLNKEMPKIKVSFDDKR